MILPSIDIRNGRAVQLRQGKDLLLEDPRDPVALAAEFGRYGPVAVVDLDAALGTGDNREIIRRCCQVAACRVGGGIRSEEEVRGWIRAGAERVMLGTRATPEFVSRFPPDWIVACLDARREEIVVQGWTEASGRKLLDAARALDGLCSGLLFTQVEVEGTLKGCDLETAARLREAVRAPITVAGGISSIEEIRKLEEMGCSSQLGRALYEGRINLDDAWVSVIQFDERGLVPTVTQEVDTGEVLMLAYSSAESLKRALQRGEGWYHSRSRQELWRKGATSGNEQTLVRARWDCDRDTVLFQVRQKGPACHRGTGACFDVPSSSTLVALERTLERRRVEAREGSYTRRLLDDPVLLADKLREETGEVIEADRRDDIVWECADLLYHLMVRMQAGSIQLEDVKHELRSRFHPCSRAR